MNCFSDEEKLKILNILDLSILVYIVCPSRCFHIIGMKNPEVFEEEDFPQNKYINISILCIPPTIFHVARGCYA